MKHDYNLNSLDYLSSKPPHLIHNLKTFPTEHSSVNTLYLKICTSGILYEFSQLLGKL